MPAPHPAPCACLMTHTYPSRRGITASSESQGSAPRTLSIDRHWNGPRRFANGGFAAGSIASFVDADVATVILRRPIPLATPLRAVTSPTREVTVHHRRRLIAEARPGAILSTSSPASPTYGEAEAASLAHPLRGVRHALSNCVVCGPKRSDGMGVTPGPLSARPGVLAAVWHVDHRVCRGSHADVAAVWAALDCPSYPAAALQQRILCVLGTITVDVRRRPAFGAHLVVYGWTRKTAGRRYETSAVLVEDGGDVVARSDAIWVALKRQNGHTTPAPR